jgi:hypothetical protein
LHKTRPSTRISQTYHEIPLNNKENKVGKNPPLLFPKNSSKVQISLLVIEKESTKNLKYNFPFKVSPKNTIFPSRLGRKKSWL